MTWYSMLQEGDMVSSVGTFLNVLSGNKANNSSTSTSTSNFQTLLSNITDKSTNSSTAGTDLMKPVATQVDQADEAAATKELLALMKMLTLGKIDYSVLGNSDTNKQVADGPVRAELERLKTIIRKIISPTGESGSSDQDKLSLKTLFDDLPDETKALLRRVFPNLDQLLKNEEKKIAEEKARNSDQLLNAGVTIATDEYMLTAVPAGNFL
jgi:hypothetical protein